MRIVVLIALLAIGCTHTDEEVEDEGYCEMPRLCAGPRDAVAWLHVAD